MSASTAKDPISVAITLLRTARAGSLATVEAGQPFASLITPAAAPDRSLLMLLSGLSPHTRHLRQEPRCSVLLAGAATNPNPQTSPRITLLGAAALEPDPGAKTRWLALHPYAGFYADLPDFQLWRMRIERAQFVGGFASARQFSAAELAPDPSAVATLAEHESGIIAHCNAGHPDAMDVIAGAYGGTGPGWRMVTCDVDGCDLARSDTVIRVPWPSSAASPGEVRRNLVQFARAARNPVVSLPLPEV